MRNMCERPRHGEYSIDNFVASSRLHRVTAHRRGAPFFLRYNPLISIERGHIWVKRVEGAPANSAPRKRLSVIRRL